MVEETGSVGGDLEACADLGYYSLARRFYIRGYYLWGVDLGAWRICMWMYLGEFLCLLNHFDCMAGCSAGYRCRETAEACADYDDVEVGVFWDLFIMLVCFPALFNWKT